MPARSPKSGSQWARMKSRFAPPAVFVRQTCRIPENAVWLTTGSTASGG